MIPAASYLRRIQRKPRAAGRRIPRAIRILTRRDVHARLLLDPRGRFVDHPVLRAFPTRVSLTGDSKDPPGLVGQLNERRPAGIAVTRILAVTAEQNAHLVVGLR